MAVSAAEQLLLLCFSEMERRRADRVRMETWGWYAALARAGGALLTRCEWLEISASHL